MKEKEEKERGKKIYLKKIWQKIWKLKFGEVNGHPDWRSSTDFHEEEPKEIHTKTHYNQIAKSQRLRKNF